MSAPTERENELSGDALNTEGLPHGSTPVGNSLDELTERLRDAGGVNSDWANVIAENWKKVLGAGVLILLGVWFVNDFRNAARQKQGDASDKFTSMEEVYRSAITPAAGDTAADKEQAQRMLQALNSNVQLLEKGYSDSVYAELAYIYAASANLEKGEVAKAREALQRFDLKRFENLSAPAPVTKLEGKDLVQELAALTYLRTFLNDSSANPADVRARAKSLAYSSRIVAVDAVIALARLSTTVEEKAEVEQLVTTLSAARPELRQMLNRELGALGYDLAPIV